MFLELSLGFLQLVDLLQVVFCVLDQFVDLSSLLRHFGLAVLEVDVFFVEVYAFEVCVWVVFEEEDGGGSEDDAVEVEESFAFFDSLAVEEEAGLDFWRARPEVDGSAAVFVFLELEQRVFVEDAESVEADVWVVVFVLAADRDDLLVFEGVDDFACEHRVFVDVRDVREVHVELFSPVVLFDLLLRVDRGFLEGLFELLHDHHLGLELFFFLHELLHEQLHVFAVG